MIKRKYNLNNINGQDPLAPPGPPRVNPVASMTSQEIYAAYTIMCDEADRRDDMYQMDCRLAARDGMVKFLNYMERENEWESDRAATYAAIAENPRRYLARIKWAAEIIGTESANTAYWRAVQYIDARRDHARRTAPIMMELKAAVREAKRAIRETARMSPRQPKGDRSKLERVPSRRPKRGGAS